MGNKIYRLFEYAYIVMAAFSFYLVYTNWNDNRNRAYLFAFFAVTAIFMFFFKRKFRKKIEEQNKNK
jgi:FtsH-binding integral membrane protein